MSFPQATANDPRKILEEIHLKKQLLIKTGAPPLSTQPPPQALVTVPQGVPQIGDAHIINSTQRNALHNANTSSWAFFVPQDSSFGNPILPVLPRFDTK